MVEQSLIDKFLFENPKSFIKGDRLSDFLSENELKQEFISGLNSFYDTFKICQNCDFISIDKKIISINYQDEQSKKSEDKSGWSWNFIRNSKPASSD